MKRGIFLRAVGKTYKREAVPRPFKYLFFLDVIFLQVGVLALISHLLRQRFILVPEGSQFKRPPALKTSLPLVADRGLTASLYS